MPLPKRIMEIRMYPKGFSGDPVVPHSSSVYDLKQSVEKNLMRQMRYLRYKDFPDYKTVFKRVHLYTLALIVKAGSDADQQLNSLKRSLASECGKWISYDLREVEKVVGFQIDSQLVKRDGSDIMAVQEIHPPI